MFTSIDGNISHYFKKTGCQISLIIPGQTVPTGSGQVIRSRSVLSDQVALSQPGQVRSDQARPPRTGRVAGGRGDQLQPRSAPGDVWPARRVRFGAAIAASAPRSPPADKFHRSAPLWRWPRATDGSRQPGRRLQRSESRQTGRQGAGRAGRGGRGGPTGQRRGGGRTGQRKGGGGSAGKRK